MIPAVICSALLLNSQFEEADAAFLARVESTELLNSHDEPVPRVERDAEGRVTLLRLTDMELEESDFDAIARLESLEHLIFFRCAVTDADVARFAGLENLETLNLTSTEITDAALVEVASFPSLRALCLGDVAVTPESLRELKSQFAAAGRNVALGYSQRR